MHKIWIWELTRQEEVEPIQSIVEFPCLAAKEVQRGLQSVCMFTSFINTQLDLVGKPLSGVSPFPFAL